MTDNDFDTQRTELANRFASAGAEFLGQMPLAAAALAAIPNTQPQQYAMVGEPKAIRALLPDDMPARRMRHGQRPTEPLEWEPPAIANKAAEEGELLKSELTNLLSQGIAMVISLSDKYSAHDADTVRWLGAAGTLVDTLLGNEDELPITHSTYGSLEACEAEHKRRASRQLANQAEVEPPQYEELIEHLRQFQHNDGSGLVFGYDKAGIDRMMARVLSTPPATTGASTVLTDAQIMQAWASVDTGGNGPELVAFGRAVERLVVAAQAGQVAVPGWISVDEQEPPETELIAVRYWPYGNVENAQAVTGGRYIDGTFYNDEGNELHPPSHWCRLPYFDAEATAQASTAGGRQEGGDRG